MAGSLTPITNIRGSNNNINTNPNVTPSRLLDSTNSLRNDLMSRNLYTPNRIYPITEKNNAQNIINAIGGIASLITPFKSYNLKNTVYGRLINPAEASPLTEIGLAMLGKQFAMNSGSYMAKNALPSIKVANLFDGNKNTKLFTKNVNFKITKKEDITGFQQFLDAVVYYYPGRDYPFTKTPTNADFIKNTGTGQLTFLYQALNQNVYKQGFSTSMNFFGISSYNDITLTNSGIQSDMPLIDRKSLIGDYNNPLLGYKKYFNFFKENPYSSIWPYYDESIVNANGSMVAGMNPSLYVNSSPTQEYAPSAEFIDKNFGVGNTGDLNYNGYYLSETSNDWINKADEFNDDIKAKLVWGKNGISELANSTINYLRGSYNKADTSTIPTPDLTEFNVYSGLLEYTRNLLNASEGAVVDITRKAFTRKKNVVGFNGSAMWVANKSTYSQKSGFAGKSGIRQHSMMDQYDRFAKAIRFNGNQVYQGNANSIVNSTVIPRIHPTLKDGNANNKNLMFSIENLAVRVIGNDTNMGLGYGIIDDEYGSAIPACEVGQFNGRMMWFPPYNLEISESSSPKWESTVMVGRNEPMYSYMYTERSASLTFTLLVDYPSNLKNFKGGDKEKHRLISEFFAFGGDPYGPLTPSNNSEKTIDDKHIEIETITEKSVPSEPEVIVKPPVRIHFPNDYPTVKDNLKTAVDVLYKDKQYQIIDGCAEFGVYANSGQKFYISNGLNADIFVKIGIVPTPPPLSNAVRYTLDVAQLPVGFSQYTAINAADCLLNQNLFDVFNKPNNRMLYDINIVGAASSLGTTKYNKKLGQRRADVAMNFVNGKLKAMFGGDADALGIKINTTTLGEEQSNPLNSAGETPEERIRRFEEPNTIKERYAEISIKRNNTLQPVVIKPLTEPEKETIKQLLDDISSLDRSGKQDSNLATDCVYEERTGSDEFGNDTAILNGFKSISGNYYSPVFHSQTPEDFHRRLTFLQQCTRQGAAKRYDTYSDEKNLTAKNSVFGRQPICILRIADFFYTKVIIENLQIDYAETTWDTNPEGFGMQPMIAKVTLQLKVLGGQSLKGPVDALQNAITFNYYANSNYTNAGLYFRPSAEADNQESYINGILSTEKQNLENKFRAKLEREKLVEQNKK
jgi:hypothetical protein